MIEPRDAMANLLKACPSFEVAWDSHVREYGSELPYVAAGAFAKHLLVLFRGNDVSSFPAVGAAIERLLAEGSPWVREFAAAGVLEGIQNVWSNNGIDPEHFRNYLGQEAKRSWGALNNAWSGKTPNGRTEG